MSGTDHALLDQLGRITGGVAVLRPQGAVVRRLISLPDLPRFCLSVSVAVIDIIDAAWFGYQNGYVLPKRTRGVGGGGGGGGGGDRSAEALCRFTSLF